jgi:hypothetical protein
LVPDSRGRTILYLHAFFIFLVAINFVVLASYRRWEIGVVLLWAVAIISPITAAAGILLWKLGGYEITDAVWTFTRRRIRAWAFMVMAVAVCAASFLYLSAIIHGRAVQGARSRASQASSVFDSTWFRDLPDGARRVLERDEQMFALWMDLLESGVEDLYAGALFALLPTVFAVFVLLELRAFRAREPSRQ